MLTYEVKWNEMCILVALLICLFFFALADSEFPFQYIFLCYVKYLISRAKSAWARHFDILFIFVYIVSQGKSETNRFLWRHI